MFSTSQPSLLPQGQRVATSIGARAYFETSALLNQNVDAVFEAATRAAMLVRDAGHGGVGSSAGPTYENGHREAYGGRRSSEKGEMEKKSSWTSCCVIA